MSNTVAVLNWTRKAKGGSKYAATYRAKRGPWQFVIDVPRVGSSTLTAHRDNSLVRREAFPSLPKAKEAAYDMQSDAEKLAWVSRTGPSRDGYTATYEPYSMYVAPNDGGYQLVVSNGDDIVCSRVRESRAELNAFVSQVVDNMAPPQHWPPLEQPVDEPDELAALRAEVASLRSALAAFRTV